MALRINQGALQQLFSAPSDPVHRHLKSIATRTEERAKIRVHKDTGRTAARIRSQQIGVDANGPIFTVVADTLSALTQEFGARPHIIRARRVGAMHFFWKNQGNIETFVPKRPTRHRITAGGILIIGKGFVNHPGSAPTHFLMDSLTEIMRNQ